MSTMHIMTHTHWDREWFLPSDVTNTWLRDLFSRVFEIIARQPDYRYILDGQTLMIEDYLRLHPEEREPFERHAHTGNLLLGPYYGQIDWRVASEESLMRNLAIGIQDARQYGNPMPYGWLMDNFGHCSQAPQIHELFGIKEVFVWRGPVFENDRISSDFLWESPDGSRVYANYLMSGYRNFYNLTDTTAYLNQRIEQLQRMLTPFTPHQQLIFLNGYDLDVFPEYPFQFLPESEQVRRATPESYVQERQKACTEAELHPPIIRGELYSGKYACVFPGSLSARSYLRIENALIERLLAYYLEPMHALLATPDLPETETLWRDLLKTQLHDDIGGVGVDQIHAQMETIYQQLYAQLETLIPSALAMLPARLNLQRGTYAFMPAPFAYDSIWLPGAEQAYLLSSKGSGVAQAQQTAAYKPAQPVDSYRWENAHYRFVISPDGIRLNDNAVGGFLLEKDAGDTYNADPEPFPDVPASKVTALNVQAEAPDFARVTFARELVYHDIVIRTQEEIFLNNTPLISWKLNVTTQGKNYRLRFACDTGDTQSPVFAKMPFHIEQRPRKDANYFGHAIPDELKPVLLAAREINGVEDFPFQGFVALAQPNRTEAVCARGVREYTVDETGRILITLKRSVEWIAQGIRTRLGDAGPKMYVPAAKDERATQFELGLISVDAHAQHANFLKWFYLFEYGYLLFENKTHAGEQTSAVLWPEQLPLAGFQNFPDGRSMIRVYNPYASTYQFSRAYLATDPFGQDGSAKTAVAPNKIEHLAYSFDGEAAAPIQGDVAILNFPAWPVGEDRSTIDPAILASLQKDIHALQHEKAEAEATLATLSETDGLTYHKAKHTVIRLAREILELELSLLLNADTPQNSPAEKAKLYEQISVVGEQLNLARRHRRTYDYILSLFENKF